MMETEQILQWAIAPLAVGYGTFMLLIVSRIQTIKAETNGRIELLQENLDRKYGHALKEFDVIKNRNTNQQVDLEKRLSQFMKIKDLCGVIDEIKNIKSSISNNQIILEKELNNYIQRDEFIAIITMLGERINNEKNSVRNNTDNKKSGVKR